jgi:hypothetical protein
MTCKRVWAFAAMGAGITLGLTGAALIVAYVLEAIVARAGDPDQSLLFWYLPFLLFGLIGLATGLRMSFWALARLRKYGREYPVDSE